MTKASSWDKPECLKNADERMNTTVWKEPLFYSSRKKMHRWFVWDGLFAVSGGWFGACGEAGFGGI